MDGEKQVVYIKRSCDGCGGGIRVFSTKEAMDAAWMGSCARAYPPVEVDGEEVDSE